MNIDTREFTHCLRVQFYPGWYEEQRIRDVIGYCRKYGFRNVMLFINAEEYNVGHMTPDEADAWIGTLRRAAEAMRAEGLSVSLNPWCSLLHLDRGRTLKPGQNFTTMEDKNGRRNICVACPLDKNWKKYYLEFVRRLVSELRPEVFWVEDDFRLHNHAPLEYGGCFCRLHMAAYRKKLGGKISRREFVRRILKTGEPDPARKAWLDVSRESMAELAEEIGKAVKAACADTAVGLMSSDPKAHGLEGRDWYRVMRGFSQGGPMIDRIHLPCYLETAGKTYYWAFHFTSMLTRAFLPEETLIYPELENSAFSTYAKDSRFLQFQLESAIPLVLNGMTYDIYDFVGNGTVPSFGYGEVISAVTPYLQGVMDTGIRFEEMDGVVVPVSEFTSYHTHTGGTDNLVECISNDNWFAPHLGMSGINYRYSKKKEHRGQIVALSGQYLRNLTDGEIESLFRGNHILCDGSTVLTLCDRGLGHLAGVQSAEYIETCTGRQSFEQAEEWNSVNGIPGYRATSQEQAGDYVRIEYRTDVQTRVYTRVYDHLCREVGAGIVCVNERVGIIPYCLRGMLAEQFHDLRVGSMKKILASFAAGRKTLFYTHYTGISPFLYRKEDRDVLILVNSTLNGFGEVRFGAPDTAYRAVYAVDRATGCLRSADYEEKNGAYTVREPFEMLSTKTYILMK